MKCEPLKSCSREEFETLPGDYSGALLVDSAVLESAENCEKIRKRTAANQRIIIQDLASPTMTRLIPAESRKLQLEFQSFIFQRCEKLSALGVKEFSLVFDFKRAAADPDFYRQLKIVLRSCFGILENNHLTLLLTVYAAAEEQPGEKWFTQFRQDLLYPRIGFLVFAPEPMVSRFILPELPKEALS